MTTLPAAGLRVVTSHPAKQAVVYDIVNQVAVHHRLVAHLASVYYVPKRFPYNVICALPDGPRQRIERQLLKRRREAIPDSIVVDWPWVELAARLLPGRIPFTAQPTYRLVDSAHDAHAASWLRKHPQIDVVMPHQGSALATLRAAKTIGARSVLVTHHPFSHHQIVSAEHARLGLPPPTELPKRLLHEAHEADYLLAPSPMTAESLIEVGIPPARIKQISWGVDIVSDTRPRSRPSSGPTRFLFVGKLSLHKGLHVLHDAWNLVQRSDVCLTLVGRPVGPYESRLLQGWTDRRVRVIPEVPDISDAYREADVFVFPSLVEGFGMVTLEAMASGLPVVVTTGSRGVVREGVDGFILPPVDSAALAECMNRMADNPKLVAELGCNARERARQYTWDRFGSELSAWLTSIVWESSDRKRSTA